MGWPHEGEGNDEVSGGPSEYNEDVIFAADRLGSWCQKRGREEECRRAGEELENTLILPP